jgi:deaminated glutathione amidase
VPDVLRAAAVQLQSASNVADNLGQVRVQVTRAHGLGATLIVLPENFAYQGAEAGKRAAAEDLDGQGPILATLRELASALQIDLIAGGMPERSADPEDRPYNTSVHVDATGAVVARYRKMHLFDVDPGDGHAYRESAGTTPGSEPVLTTTAGGVKVGMTVCYDLRFPELYRAMPDARIVTVPAAFTAATGKDHWHVLLRARAIENQTFVIAPGQHGTHPETARTTYGKSLIVDPWGDVLAQAPEGVGLAVAELDFERQDAVRRGMPVRSHRRLGN